LEVYRLLNSIDPRLAWPGLLALLLVLITAAAVRLAPLGAGSARVAVVTKCGVAIILAIAAAQFAIGVRYLFYPSYLDHAEAHVVVVSWLGWEGYPLYPSLDNGDVYGVAYGPVLYQICLLYTSPSPRDLSTSRMPSSA